MQYTFTVLSSVACLALKFFHINLHRARFSEKNKLLNMQGTYWFSLQLLCETFLILRRIEQDMMKNIYLSSCKLHVILVRYERNLYFLDRFSKNIPILKFKKTHLFGAELFHVDIQTDGRTDILKLVSAFHNFASVPKKLKYSRTSIIRTSIIRNVKYPNPHFLRCMFKQWKINDYFTQ